MPRLGASGRLLGVVVLACALLALAGVRSAEALPANCTGVAVVSCTFAATGAEQTFTVPAGVSSVHVVARGAPGGRGASLDSSPSPGGMGAVVSGDLAVTAGEVVYVEVGGAPSFDANACYPGLGGVPCVGGFNGGGSSHFGGGGGGASDVRTLTGSDAGTLASRLLVAAGGGGGGEFCLSSGLVGGGAGGNAGAKGGDGPNCGVAGGTGGGAGTASAGGAGGSPFGHAGGLGAGGGGGLDTGGGGGGGVYGGGGGGDITFGDTSESTGGAGGGGGGSSLVPAGGTSGIDQTGTPSVVISYVSPAVAPVITSAAAATFTVGALGTFTVTTTGVPSPALTETGALPGGVGFVDNGDGTATISGPPAAGSAGSYPLTITASNAGGSATQAFTLTVNPAPLVVTTSALPDASLGSPYSASLAAAGGVAPYSWSLESGALPSGLSLGSGGVISGTPLVPGTSSFTVRVSDAEAPAMSATASLSITVGGCTTTVGGDGSGPLEIGAGVTCVIGASVPGPVSVGAGAVVVLVGATISGPLTADGAAQIVVCDSTIRGGITVTGTSGAVLIGSDRRRIPGLRRQPDHGAGHAHREQRRHHGHKQHDLRPGCADRERWPRRGGGGEHGRRALVLLG